MYLHQPNDFDPLFLDDSELTPEEKANINKEHERASAAVREFQDENDDHRQDDNRDQHQDDNRNQQQPSIITDFLSVFNNQDDSDGSDDYDSDSNPRRQPVRNPVENANDIPAPNYFGAGYSLIGGSAADQFDKPPTYSVRPPPPLPYTDTSAPVTATHRNDRRPPGSDSRHRPFNRDDDYDHTRDRSRKDGRTDRHFNNHGDRRSDSRDRYQQHQHHQQQHRNQHQHQQYSRHHVNHDSEIDPRFEQTLTELETHPFNTSSNDRAKSFEKGNARAQKLDAISSRSKKKTGEISFHHEDSNTMKARLAPSHPVNSGQAVQDLLRGGPVQSKRSGRGRQSHRN
jgi:hypothetical protein